MGIGASGADQRARRSIIEILGGIYNLWDPLPPIYSTLFFFFSKVIFTVPKYTFDPACDDDLNAVGSIA